MKFLKTLGFTMILIALAFLLAAALFWGLSIGTVKLPLDQIYNSVFIIFSFCFGAAYGGSAH